jgi:acetoacetate decarboxylase
VGAQPSVCELVPTTVTTNSGEVWAGTGSLRLSGASDFSPLHRLPVVKGLGATLVRHFSMTLTAATETYPL